MGERDERGCTGRTEGDGEGWLAHRTQQIGEDMLGVGHDQLVLHFLALRSQKQVERGEGRGMLLLAHTPEAGCREAQAQNPYPTDG